MYADERDGGERALTERFQKGVNGGLGKSKYERKRTHKESDERLRDRDGNPLEITEQLQLMSRTLGQLVHPLETEVEIRDSKPNAYEATLRFTDPEGVQKYYPAGTPLNSLNSPQEVLQKTFAALVWVSAHGPANDTYFIIWKIVKRYPFFDK